MTSILMKMDAVERLYMEIKHNNYRGFTFLELLVSLTVILILVAAGISNYEPLFAQQTLIQKTEHLYHFLRLAQTQAIKDNAQVYVHFCQDTNPDIWKIAMSDSSAADSCSLNSNNKFEQLTDGQHLFATINFGSKPASYKPMRFHANPGNVTFSNHNGDTLKVIQSSMRLRVCSPGSAQLGYKQC
jgi:type IV fimbrial biogenesis protein FimT